jgi:uncharacterized protein YdeI (YjbR/CyaY-like superfamily)
MNAKRTRGLKRPTNPMPAFVRQALTERELMAAYRARPAYQRNDYLGWIARAKREVTRRRRLEQMLEELEGGRRYMKMRWSGGGR